MDSVMVWLILAIVVLLIVAAFAGRRGTTHVPPLEGATPYDRPSGLGDPGNPSGPADPGGGSSAS